jgi:DNA repair protein RadC
MAEGHRSRLRKRFAEEDIDNMPEHVVLEMMLHGVIARQDTSAIARRLLEEFGNLAQVIDAPIQDLMKVKGMGEISALHLKLIPKFYRRYQLSKWDKNIICNDANIAGDFLVHKLIGYTNEVVVVLCLDSNCKLLNCKTAFEGSINTVHISIRKIVEIALSSNASRVIISHNHLSGNALPSSDDLETTRRIHSALNYVGVTLDDHIIVADDDFVSLAQSGFFIDNM